MNSDYIIKVNGIEYHSYQDLCASLDIDYKTFMKIKLENKGLLQAELLECFYDRVMIRMTDSSFFVSEKNKKQLP